MCGVFGFVSKNGEQFDPKRLEKIARVTETRGPHAFGLAWVDEAGRLQMFKQTGKISDHLGVLSFAKNARMLIGHCRWATHGRPENNINNHPHPADGGWYVHNGVISHYQDIIKDYSLHPMSRCDSEVLGGLIESLPGPMIDRCIEAVQIAGGSKLSMLGLWHKRMIAVRSGGQDLHVGEAKNGFYIASLRRELVGDVWEVRDETALEFTFKGDETILSGYDVRQMLDA